MRVPAGRWPGPSADSPVTGSVAGGALTAVPGGVWVSFRTGMAGETILLRQSDLAMTGPSSAQLDAPFSDSVFDWMMSASMIYGRATLLLVNEDGVLACIDPQSAVVRVQEHLAIRPGRTQSFSRWTWHRPGCSSTDSAGSGVASTPLELRAG